MDERAIRNKIITKYRQTFPEGTLEKVFCGQCVTRHGSRITGATPGTPDLVGYLPNGRFIGIEVKVPGAKKQRHEQAQSDFRDHSNAAGCLCIQVTSWEEVLQAVEDAIRIPFA